jgi:hypothetical protein
MGLDTSQLLVIFVVVSAIGFGLAANRFVRPLFIKSDTDGPGVPALLAPIMTLSALFIAIVLSQSAASYSAARAAAAKEANVVDNFFEYTEYIAEPHRQALQASTVCYARAVSGPEWEAMGRGEDSRVPNNWTGTGPHGFRGTFQAMGPRSDLFGSLTSQDSQRGDLRRDRLTQARPSVPSVIYGFMMFLVGLTIVGLLFSIPRQDNVPQIVTLTFVAMLIALSVIIIRSFDRPFSGPLAIEPVEMHETARQITEDYFENYSSPLPCDDRGNPLPASLSSNQ